MARGTDGKKKDGRLKERVKSASGRSLSSTRWLQRQLNDPYVAEAKKKGYRARAAFKLTEIDEKLRVLKPGARVVDLGAAPGSWTQVAVERVKGGQVVAIDINEMDPVPGATVLQADFLADSAPALIRNSVGGPVDVLLSDMAAPASGQPDVDHLRIMNLVEAALELAREVLRPGGAFITKMLQGGQEHAFILELRKNFTEVKRIKPPSSRSDSAEFFIAATGFRKTS
jgi:23S rRNA (uridine2552-2'-O)-methyltransferase